MKNVSESLAGRVAILELSGLSLREMQGIGFNEPFIPTEKYIAKRGEEYRPCERIWQVIHRGNYPALIEESMDWQVFYSSYVQTYLDRDVNMLIKIKDKLKFTQFLTAMAARTGQMLNYSSVASQIEVSVATVKEWTSILEASGIISIIQPYSNSALSRATKTPKLYFRDTGLVCFLTKYQTAEMAMNGALAGQLFETFAVSEILKSFTNSGRDYRLYVTYYRGKDKSKANVDGETVAREAEIDLLIEQDETIYPVEIKMSANPKLSMTNAFDVIEKIPGKKRGVGVILCMYDSVLWLKENIVALPIEYV